MKRFLAMAVVVTAVLAIGAVAVQAGAVGGPKLKLRETVAARDYDIYRITFHAGELAQVVVSGDGDTDLDLYVYDEFGNLIGSDTDGTDDCLVRWVHRFTGSFTIKVVNRGTVYNRYNIATN